MSNTIRVPCGLHKGSKCPRCDGSGFKDYAPKKRKKKVHEYGGLIERSIVSTGWVGHS